MTGGQTAKITLASLAIVAGGALAVRSMLGGRTVGERAWYYDESAGRLFVAPSQQHPPIRGVDGPETDGVRAMVYVCGDECTEKDRKIAYLQKYTDEMAEARRQWDKMEARGERGPAIVDDRDAVTEATLVRRVEDAEWVSKASAAGKQIVAIMLERCEDGSYPKQCDPDD